MRVLCVGNMYPPHHLGGYELVWRSAVGELRRRGHNVRVLTSDYRRAGADGPEDADVHRELRWYWRDHRFPRLSPAGRVALERHNHQVLARHLADQEPDVLSWWGMGGMSLSLVERVRRAGLPAVGFVSDDWLLYGPKVDQWIQSFRRLPGARGIIDLLTGIPTHVDLGRSGRWVFVSEATRGRALEGGLALPDTAVRHTGIDPAFVDPAPAGSWEWRLLYFGRLDERKGVDTALEALALLPSQATLTIVGDGDPAYRERLGGRAAELGVGERVRFQGIVSRERLHSAIAEHDAVVFPVRWDEPWGLVPLEGMGRGRPVVATGRGGSGEYLEDGVNCLLFGADDPAGLAAAVVRLATDERLRQRLIAQGMKTAARYTEDAFNQGVAEELCRAAGRLPAGGSG